MSYKVMQLSKKEIIVAFALSGLLFIVPAMQDWLSRGAVLDHRVLTSSVIWLTGFYWGPMVLLLLLKHVVKFLEKQRAWLDFPVYLLLMFVGISWVNFELSAMFDNYEIVAFDRLFSSLLWGGFFYAAYRFWLTFKAFQIERVLRKQAQIDAIKGKLNPHFLFNSLNTISSYIHSNPDVADQTLHHLADVLRYSLDTHKNDRVTLRSEINALSKYLEIEQTRFGDNLTFLLDLPTECERALVPPMLLQPLLENSLKHARVSPLQLSVTARCIGRELQIEVRDNGKGFENESLDSLSSAGHGLALTEQRIRLIKGGALTLKNDNGATVQMSLAFESQGESSC